MKNRPKVKYIHGDYEVLHEAMDKLATKEQDAIYCRYWREMSIMEISEKLGISWDDTDHLLTQSLQKLKALMSNDKRFTGFLMPMMDLRSMAA